MVLIIFLTSKVSSDTSIHSSLLSRKDRLNYVKNSFLNRFGLNEKIHKPLKGASHEDVPPYLWNIYHQKNFDHFDTMKYILPTKIKRKKCQWIIDYDTKLLENEYMIQIYLITNLSKIFSSIFPLKYLSIKVMKEKEDFVNIIISDIEEENYDWKNIDISHLIDMKNPLKKLRLSLKPDPEYCENIEKNNTRLSRLINDDAALIIFLENTLGTKSNRVKKNIIDNTLLRRVKRNTISESVVRDIKSTKRKAGHSKNGRGRKLCQKTDLYVDFKELNWDDWILAPEGYNAYQCRGICSNPLPSKLNTTNHAIIQSLINTLNPLSVPAPCCIPTRLAPLSILFVDFNKHVVIKNYAEMIVVECGCN
uniref:TGF_BETA_2 domain-containing protein n=1 Tax=Parastrongyloides trichosuri TaxID=131310 RepID=A0A0N4ZSY2_PARTI